MLSIINSKICWHNSHLNRKSRKCEHKWVHWPPFIRSTHRSAWSVHSVTLDIFGNEYFVSNWTPWTRTHTITVICVSSFSSVLLVPNEKCHRGTAHFKMAAFDRHLSDRSNWQKHHKNWATLKVSASNSCWFSFGFCLYIYSWFFGPNMIAFALLGYKMFKNKKEAHDHIARCFDFVNNFRLDCVTLLMDVSHAATRIISFRS